jgi:hypothetical protein
MSWSQRRKSTYILSVLIIFIIIIIIILFSVFNKPATCFDRVQNQGEFGIDCGGPCTLLCRAQYSDPTVLWVRWAQVKSSGTYNVLTYAQNPNLNIGAKNVPYIFKIYDKNNVLLFQKTGLTYIPPNNNFSIFEDGININDKIPARIEFNFLEGIIWTKLQGQENNISAISKNLTGEDIKPKLAVTIQNKLLLPINNIEVVAILYDQNDNAVAFSKTKVDFIDKEGTQNVVFTWPEKFSEKIYRIEVLSKVMVN